MAAEAGAEIGGVAVIALDFIQMTMMLGMSVVAAVAMTVIVVVVIWVGLSEIGYRLGSSWPPLYPIIGSILFWAAIMALAAHLVMA